MHISDNEEKEEEDAVAMPDFLRFAIPMEQFLAQKEERRERRI